MKLFLDIACMVMALLALLPVALLGAYWLCELIFDKFLGVTATLAVLMALRGFWLLLERV